MLYLLSQTAQEGRGLQPHESTRNRRRRGAAMLETALVLTTLVSMIVFIMDMGRLLLIQQFITERARVTVRAAVVNNWTSNSAANFFCYSSTSAPSGDTSTPGYLGLLPSQVSYQALGSSTASDYRLQITVSGVPLVTFIPFISGTYTAAPITVTMPAQSLGAAS
jgi:Flp pilus assembly protein TadG